MVSLDEVQGPRMATETYEVPLTVRENQGPPSDRPYKPVPPPCTDLTVLERLEGRIRVRGSGPKPKPSYPTLLNAKAQAPREGGLDL